MNLQFLDAAILLNKKKPPIVPLKQFIQQLYI